MAIHFVEIKRTGLSFCNTMCMLWNCLFKITNVRYWYIIRTSPVSLNSLRPSDAIWRQWSWTTLAQVMACCLTAPSHYLNQCWLIIRGVLWHTSESSFAGIAQGIDSGYEFEKDILKNIFKSPRGQWVKVRCTKIPAPLQCRSQCYNHDICVFFMVIYMWIQ